MPDLDGNEAALPVRLMGADATGKETYPVQVDLIDGVRRLNTTGLVQIEELFGQDNQADVWFYINTQYDVGPMVAGDTIRILIAAGPDATLFPVIDLTYTIVAGDVAASNPEVEVAKNIVSMLNTDVTFRQQWRAQRIADNSCVWIGSKMVGEWSERRNSGDFTVTATGTVTVLAAFDKIVRRGKSTSLTKDPGDPRLGVLGITGTVAQGAASLGQLHFDNPSLNGLEVTYEMAVDGSVTPQVFQHPAETGFDIFVQELRFYGSDNGIKFGQFLAQNNPLTNGILIDIKSDDQTTTFPIIKTTEDFKNKFAVGGQWSLEIQAGSDQFLATFKPTNAFPQRAVGTFGTDDYINISIRDDLTSITTLQMEVFGFLVEA